MEKEDLSQGRIIDYKAFNFVDGEGCVTLSMYQAVCFTARGCYNVATWSFNAGIPYTAELEEQIMADLAQPYVQGLTLLGGEPFSILAFFATREAYSGRNCQTRTSGLGRAIHGKK